MESEEAGAVLPAMQTGAISDLIPTQAESTSLPISKDSVLDLAATVKESDNENTVEKMSPFIM